MQLILNTFKEEEQINNFIYSHKSNNVTILIFECLYIVINHKEIMAI